MIRKNTAHASHQIYMHGFMPSRMHYDMRDHTPDYAPTLMRNLIRRHWLKILALAAGLIFIVATVLIDATGETHVKMIFPEMDKLVHFFTFGFMAYLCIALLHEIDVLNAFFLPFQTIFFVSFVGMLTEVIQSHTATRTADLNDLAADFAGAVVFVLLWYGVIKRKQTLRQRNWQ